MSLPPAVVAPFLAPATPSNAAIGDGIAVYRSGDGTANGCLGGAKAATALDVANGISIITGLPTASYTVGDIVYRCIYIQSSIVASYVKAYIPTDTPSLATTIAIGWGASAVNVLEPAIADDSIAPPGVVFSEPRALVDAISGGPFAVNSFRALWVRETLTATAKIPSETFKISVFRVLDAPTVVTLPAITGTLTSGSTLTASPGTWLNTPTSYAYQWQASLDGMTGWVTVDIASTYVPILGGFYLRLMVQAINTIGASAPVYSVVRGPLTVGTPVATVAPVISGTPFEGFVLSATTGTWASSPTSYTYAWQMVANQLDAWSGTGTDSPNLPQTSTHVGKFIRARVTGNNASGPGTAATSNVLGPITSAANLVTVNGELIRVDGEYVTAS